MKSVVKDDNPGSPGCITRDLDGIFNCLSTGCKKCNFFGKSARRYLCEASRECHIWFVHDCCKTGMRKFCGLLCNGPGNFWMSMTNVHSPVTNGKIDVTIAINIFDDGAIRSGGKDIRIRMDGSRYKLLALNQ